MATTTTPLTIELLRQQLTAQVDLSRDVFLAAVAVEKADPTGPPDAMLEFRTRLEPWHRNCDQLVASLPGIGIEWFDKAGTPATESWATELYSLLLFMRADLVAAASCDRLPGHDELPIDDELPFEDLGEGELSWSRGWRCRCFSLVEHLDKASRAIIVPLASGNSEGVPIDAVAHAVALGAIEAEVLEYLAKHYPQLINQVDITVNVDADRKTVGRALAMLEDNRLAHRPRGERSGYTVTAAGSSLANTLAKSTH